MERSVTVIIANAFLHCDFYVMAAVGISMFASVLLDNFTKKRFLIKCLQAFSLALFFALFVCFLLVSSAERSHVDAYLDGLKTADIYIDGRLIDNPAPILDALHAPKENCNKGKILKELKLRIHSDHGDLIGQLFQQASSTGIVYDLDYRDPQYFADLCDRLRTTVFDAY